MSDTKESISKAELYRPERREFLSTLILGGAGAATAALLPERAAAAIQAPPDKTAGLRRPINSAADNAVVEVTSGKIRGYTRNGIFTFKGVPYGDTTAGANRFTVAKKPKPWAGIRTTMAYGKTCPQSYRQGWSQDEEKWQMHWSDGVPGEDCLVLNVWTPALDGRKRAVMFWLHGGGYTAGSGEELPGYDGENLARTGDVVVVGINHRLNVLGFMNLQKYGEQFAHSANISQLDIIAALQWVHENIADFGGDPGMVTIFGQSGGGGKVSYLMGMPGAHGLFHRAIVESGSRPGKQTVEDSAKLSDMVLAELQITPDRIAALQTMPYEQLNAAATQVLRRLRPAEAPNMLRRSGANLGWSPCVDGEVIPVSPFYPTPPEMSASVPLLIGSTLNEFVTSINHPEYEALTEQELQHRVETALPGKGAEAIAIYRKADPQASPFSLWSEMNATTAMRRNAVELGKQKSAQSAPVFNYLFRWQSPVLDGRTRAVHCSEIPHVFNNAEHWDTMTGGGQDAQALAAKISAAWVAFAKTGNPNHSGLPKWEPVKGDRVPSMNFDNTCVLRVNADEDQLKITL